MNKILCLLILTCYVNACLFSQNSNSLFNSIYPIGQDPNIGYATSMVPDVETIIFQANPILRLPIYNNIRRNLMNDKDKASTLFINFRPQIRIYTDASFPVKTPTYKIGILNYQQMYRLSRSSPNNSAKDQILSFSFETGHYSNGQANCALSAEVKDGTTTCDSLYGLLDENSNLSDLINRESGNYSTNFTEIRVKYQYFISLDGDYIPKSSFSLELGYNRYHDYLLYIFDIGGYSENDIKLYGKNRFYLDVEYMFSFDESTGFLDWVNFDRYSINFNSAFISKPHASVNPFRGELGITAYFPNNLGIFVSAIYGHDNYNFRFVDSGFQFFAGISLDIFPPIQIKT